MLQCKNVTHARACIHACIYLQKTVLWWKNCRTRAAPRSISHLAGIPWTRSRTRHRTCSRPWTPGRYRCNTHTRWPLRLSCCLCRTDRKPFCSARRPQLQSCTLYPRCMRHGMDVLVTGTLLYNPMREYMQEKH